MRIPGAGAQLGRNAHFLRPALIALLAIDLLALAAFSVRLEAVTTTTVTPGAPAVVSTAPVQPSTQVPVPPAVPVVLPPSAPVLTPVAPAQPTAPEPTEPPATDPEEPTAPGGPSARIARCTIPIKEPTTSGGLQSLISFAPAFGPFKDEAFAAASAYQPLLQLLGPILARYPAIAPKIEPAMQPFLDAFAGLLDRTFTLIAPFYAPYRQDVLAAEAKLAAALGPYAQTLATSPLGGCIVELQAALLEDSNA